MSKQRNIRRDAKRTKPQGACGHASRYRNKRGCAICRRENGATMGKEFKPRKIRAVTASAKAERNIGRMIAEALLAAEGK